MSIIETKIEIGAKKPFRVVHISDTHLTYADMRDGERKVALSERRSQYFKEAEETLALAAETAKRYDAPILHTGDLSDFVSLANLERVKRYVEENDLFMAAGNHEFSLYVGEAKEDAAYRNQSLAKVQAVYHNDIRSSSRVIEGVNFVALDNGYYQFDEGELAFLKNEVAKGLPIVLMMHTPLYEPALYEKAPDAKKKGSAYLIDVPTELMERDYDPRHFAQKADEITHETMEYIASQPLIKAVLSGHLHFNFEGTVADRIPQVVTACTTVRVIEFV
jgi:3',5'-cyclic AMP phosphodiesterase CpdA